MAETRMLTDRDEIRDWAAARSGAPAIRDAMPSVGQGEPLLTLVFDQHAYQDQDQGWDRAPGMGDLQIVEWDDWFKAFEEHQLGLVVGEEVAGRRDSFFEIVRR